MKKIRYANKEIKGKIRNCKDNILATSLELLMSKYTDVMVLDIKESDNKILLSCCSNECDFNVCIDKLSHRLLLSSYAFPYQEEYTVADLSWALLGKIYQAGNQSVYLADSYDKVNHYYHFKGENVYFDISINGYNYPINDELIIRYLLSLNIEEAKTIDILNLLNRIIDLKEVNLKISKSDNNILTIYNGVLTKYIDYEKRDGVIYKTYLDKDKFYVEKTTKEEVNDDIVPFVKKLTRKEK